MAGPSLGNASLILSTNASALYAGLGAAGGFIQSWAKKTNSSIGGGLTSFGKFAFGGAVAGLAALGGELAIIQSKIKDLANTARTAQSLGIEAEVFQGLTLNAKKFGVESEDMVSALTKLGAHFADSGKEGNEFRAKLAGLGVVLENQTSASLFMQIADAIKAMPTAAEQSAAAIDLFKKQGVALLPVLQQGGKGIHDFMNAMKEKGVLISNEDFAAIQRVKAEIPKLQMYWDALWNKITIAALPLIEMLNQKLSAGLNSLLPILQKVGEAAEGAFSALVDWAGRAYKWVTDLVQSINQMTGTLDTNQAAALNWGDVMVTVGANARKVWSYFFDSLKAVLGGIMIGIGTIIEGIGSMIGTIGKALEAIDAFWGTDFYKGTVDRIRGIENEIKRWGTAIKEGGIEEFKEFGQEAKRIDKELDAMLAKRMADRMKAKQAVPPPAAFNPKGATGDYQATAAALQGSKEDISIRARARVNALLDPKMDKQLAELKKANELKQKGNDAINKVVDAIKGVPLLGVI